MSGRVQPKIGACYLKKWFGDKRTQQWTRSVCTYDILIKVSAVCLPNNSMLYTTWHYPDEQDDLNLWSIVLGLNDTSTLVGHFVLSPGEREKRDRRDSREDEREGQGKKKENKWKWRNRRNKKTPTSPPHPHPPLPLPAARTAGLAKL